ncbi:hypothetical protein SanaruYs_13850 [Chryseotalea sanaruensis]|jgi:hypothetical protein|uniref:Outer membrane protein beta-barrel domain-containing protein n=1 Tax=Chryseotalea sanaruensis TaxID=2482724 RepID=A0A401U8G3_9BACT|nr:hypothetical protein [Chryseotalea sanaruensis]GCC51165.1 hypothetical protein SanaruYs_13850 [Chryseotalea sanaruensis]
MKKHITKLFAMAIILGTGYMAQAQSSDEVKTIFKNTKGSGGYVVLSNKLTSIHGSFANMPEIYGGWFIGKKFLLGVGGGSTTNYIPVDINDSANPSQRMSYLYGQFGMVNELVIASNSPIHPVFHLFNGAGFTMQYHRPRWEDLDNQHYREDVEDLKWYYICEPALQVELNLLKWLRVSPGISYRFAFDNEKRSLDDKVSGPSVSLGLKFGKF